MSSTLKQASKDDGLTTFFYKLPRTTKQIKNFHKFNDYFFQQQSVLFVLGVPSNFFIGIKEEHFSNIFSGPVAP